MAAATNFFWCVSLQICLLSFQCQHEFRAVSSYILLLFITTNWWYRSGLFLHSIGHCGYHRKFDWMEGFERNVWRASFDRNHLRYVWPTSVVVSSSCDMETSLIFLPIFWFFFCLFHSDHYSFVCNLFVWCIFRKQMIHFKSFLISIEFLLKFLNPSNRRENGSCCQQSFGIFSVLRCKHSFWV